MWVYFQIIREIFTRERREKFGGSGAKKKLANAKGAYGPSRGARPFQTQFCPKKNSHEPTRKKRKDDVCCAGRREKAERVLNAKSEILEDAEPNLCGHDAKERQQERGLSAH